ncbi:hypothetical protein MNBD_GAMMA01-494 [hydrothermal vent metagenome]|uniref:Uncharacterized protein n=1 Tax=hydrothermal vent metagenome TaxID=652676 RepID=A0A3B0VIE5_9ZZZZ
MNSISFTIKLVLILSVIIIASIFNLSQAQKIPKDLSQWQEWIKYEQEFQDCPYFYNKDSKNQAAHVCAWPATLELNIQDDNAKFSINWDILQDSWIILPGGQKSWPQTVKANNIAQIVQRHNGLPRIFLSKGKYNIRGNFSWQKRPENLLIPIQVADINLVIDNTEIRFPQIKGTNLWLGANTQATEQQLNKTEFKVNRLLIDGHPMIMYVVLDLYISGSARNEKLGKIANQHLQVTSIGGDISAYIDNDGYLWAQLKPGNWQIDIGFMVLNWPEKIEFNPDGEFWPNQEIWAYQDNKNIRITQIKGVKPINPEQANSRWSEVPNFLINSGESFEIIEQKRGTLNQSAQLNLYRTIWLAFNGESLRSRDEINGGKLGSWRLNGVAGYQLLNAKNHNKNMLITKSAEGSQGLELRTPNIDLIVNSEFTKEVLSNITPWQANFDYIKTEMFLPYGYLPFAVSNVDASTGIWLEKWQLWDVFIVMLITIFCYKVIGIKSAVLAFVTLTLGYHEYSMPLIAWINILVIAALLSIKPTGKILSLIRSYAVVSVLGLLMVLMPFLVAQVRLSIYPQLEQTMGYSDSFISRSEVKSVSKKRAPMKQLNQAYEQTYSRMNAIVSQSPPANVEADKQQLGKLMVTGSRIRNSDLVNRYQTGAILQAGKGLPLWQTNKFSLRWEGPINDKQKFKLILVPPVVRTLWRLLLVFTSIFWLILLVKKLKNGIFNNKVTKVNTALLLLMVFIVPNMSFAQNYPPESLLDELHNRIYQQQPCKTNCAAINASEVTVNGSNLQITLNYHAFDDVIVAIPHSKDWRVEDITVNGKLQNNQINYKNTPWISIKKGINTIKLSGELASRNSISILYPLSPGSISASANGWQIAGIDGNVLNNNTLQLISTVTETTAAKAAKSTDIKQFFSVKRSITFDDDWFVTTTVQRVAPNQGAVNISIPLMNNEHPTDKVQTDTQGNIVVSLDATTASYIWGSRLDKTPEIKLLAASNSHYLETWEILASPQWNIDISGVEIMTPADIEGKLDDYFTHVYKPRPNESLTIKINRPQATAGEIISVESINNVFRIGQRSTKVLTTIVYRATQGGNFYINLAKTADINRVAYDGVESNLTNDDGVVAVSFLPGKHKVIIDWQVNKSLNIINQTPSISLQNNYTNISQQVQIPKSRWILYGYSKGVGPAFLYWGEFLVFTLLAFFLARLPYSILKFWQWLVLGYAFGTVSWFAFGFVTIWLFFIGWKNQQPQVAKNTKSILLQWFTLFVTAIVLIVFIGAVASGLLSYPNMGVTGMNSYASNLNWFMDTSQNQLPNITIISVPIWWYKALMLLWSIWVSFALINWLKQVINGFDKNQWWRKPKKKIGKKEIIE